MTGYIYNKSVFIKQNYFTCLIKGEGGEGKKPKACCVARWK